MEAQAMRPLTWAEKVAATSLTNVGHHGLKEALEKLTLTEIIELKLAHDINPGQDLTDRAGTIFDEVMSAVERPLVEIIYSLTGENQVHTANLLGVNRNTARKKLLRYGFLGRVHCRTAASAPTSTTKNLSSG